MMRMKSSSKQDETASSMELDQMELMSGRENLRIQGDEEVEINCDGFVVDIKEVPTDRLQAVGFSMPLILCIGKASN